MGASSRPPRIVVLYQYQHPDDVVSARLYDDLCVGLSRRGWEVVARPSNRSCHDPAVAYPLRESWTGVTFRRVWRPGLRQNTSHGRITNAAWMIGAWLAALIARAPRSAPDVALIGTDPLLSIAAAPLLKRLRPSMRIAHWVHDLYPEAAFAEDMLRPRSVAGRALTSIARRGYRACDLIADLGPTMRVRLDTHGHDARRATIPPWALTESPAPPQADASTREALFGRAGLALLYSGNLGRPHDHAPLLSLARALRGSGAHLCFAGRGPGFDRLRGDLSAADTNVSLEDFCGERGLPSRLGAADVHLVSLRPEWAGIVVPSKFFGALAVGRPVLFSGPPASDLARLIREHRVGWVLEGGDEATVAEDLRTLAREPERLQRLKARCHAVYLEHFSRERGLEQWDRELRLLLPPGPHG